jgi:hypothetical protein
MLMAALTVITLNAGADCVNNSDCEFFCGD